MHKADDEVMVEVSDHSESDRDVIKNLYAFYRYDLMPFIGKGRGAHVNDFGTIGAQHDRTHEESARGDDVWWQKPGGLFAYLIRADELPAGFAMVALPPHATPGVDFRLNDFFVLNRLRGLGVGRQAAIQVFDRFQGVWELGWVPGNTVAALFWRSVVSHYTRGRFEECLVGMGKSEPPMPGLRFVSASESDL